MSVLTAWQCVVSISVVKACPQPPRRSVSQPGRIHRWCLSPARAASTHHQLHCNTTSPRVGVQLVQQLYMMCSALAVWSCGCVSQQQQAPVCTFKALVVSWQIMWRLYRNALLTGSVSVTVAAAAELYSAFALDANIMALMCQSGQCDDVFYGFGL